MSHVLWEHVGETAPCYCPRPSGLHRGRVAALAPRHVQTVLHPGVVSPAEGVVRVGQFLNLVENSFAAKMDAELVGQLFQKHLAQLQGGNDDLQILDKEIVAEAD